MSQILDLSSANVPQSYREFLAKTPNNQMTLVCYGRKESANKPSTPCQDYDIYAHDMLIRNKPYDKNSPPNYQWGSHAELEFKSLEGEIDGITFDDLRQAFYFGSVDGGIVFSPKRPQCLGNLL